MTNYERIKGYSFEEMTEFLVNVTKENGDFIAREACAQCRKENGSCSASEAEDPYCCRLSEVELSDRRREFRYWLNMSPNP